MEMEKLQLLGSIASIISPIGIVFWKIIKKKEMSPFNRCMSVILLIQAILIGYWLLNGEILGAVISVGVCFIFTILPWLIMHVYDQLLNLILDITNKQSEISKSQTKIIGKINQDMKMMNENIGVIVTSFKDMIEIIKKLTIYTESTIDIKTKQLEDKVKKIQKKISK